MGWTGTGKALKIEQWGNGLGFKQIEVALWKCNNNWNCVSGISKNNIKTGNKKKKKTRNRNQKKECSTTSSRKDKEAIMVARRKKRSLRKKVLYM